MARINRSDVIQKAVNDLAISATTDKVPNETLDKVQLTYSLNNHFSSFLIAGNQTTTGTFTATLPTVSAGSETYLTAITLSMAKDATCDVATGSVALSVRTTDNNTLTVILRIQCITLTADAQTVTLSLPYPLKLVNGSTASCTGTFTVGAMSRGFTLTGFTTSSN